MPSPDQQWLPLPNILILQPGEVHCWRASLNQPDMTFQHLQAILSPDEQAKAARFHFAKDRNHYIVARGILRTLLGGYLQSDPRSLRFSYNAYGKPALDRTAHHEDVRFNLAHSHGLALCAFAPGREVGIDVEYMKPDIDVVQVARHSFSPGEQAALHALPPEDRLQGFYNGWTRKEAYIKARGMGVSLRLDRFDVSLKPGEPAALLYSREDPQEAARWVLIGLEPGEGYAGALAVEGRGWRLRRFEWSA
jgi:4'-phosphopantetheinyl transferase